MGMHASMIKKLREAGYNQDNPDDAVKAFLDDNKDYSDKIVAEKIGVSEGAIFNWRKKFGMLKGDDRKSPYSGFEAKLKELGYEVGENETLTSVMRKYLMNTLITSKLSIEQVAEKLQTTPEVIRFWIKRLSLEDKIPERIEESKSLAPGEPAKEKKERKTVKKEEKDKTVEEVLDLLTNKKEIEKFIEENAFNLGRKYMRQVIKGMYSELRDILQKIK